MTEARVATRYDRSIGSRLTSLLYDDSDFLNFGYWTADTTTQKQASENLVAKLLSFIPDKRGNILDVACGLGASTRYLSRYYSPADITAINLSEAQLARGRVNAPGCNFLYMDAVRLEFADAAFDNLICVEAAFHFNTRESFYREAFRVLKPGGRLVTSDILMPKWASGRGHHNYVANPSELEKRLRSAGFTDVIVEDTTRESWGGFCENLIRIPGQRRRAGAVSFGDYVVGVVAGLYMNLLFARGMRFYVVTSARKPY